MGWTGGDGGCEEASGGRLRYLCRCRRGGGGVDLGKSEENEILTGRTSYGRKDELRLETMERSITTGSEGKEGWLASTTERNSNRRRRKGGTEKP